MNRTALVMCGALGREVKEIVDRFPVPGLPAA